MFTVFPISAQEVIIGDSANISVKNIEYEVSNVPGEDSTLLIIVENIGGSMVQDLNEDKNIEKILMDYESEFMKKYYDR